MSYTITKEPTVTPVDQLKELQALSTVAYMQTEELHIHS